MLSLSTLLGGGLLGRNAVALGLALVFTLASLTMQGVEYTRLYVEHNTTYYHMLEQDAKCTAVKKAFPNAHGIIDEDECGAATRTIQTNPGYAAFVELVNTTWPHESNIRAQLSSLLGSYWVNGCLFALGIVATPFLTRHFASLGDAYKKKKLHKALREHEKLLLEHSISKALQKETQKRSPKVEEVADSPAPDWRASEDDRVS